MIDNRHDLKYHPKKCYVCLEESPSDCVYTEMAHYAEDTGNMMMMGRLACAKCREEIISVREYVKSQALAFGKNSKAFEQNIEPHLLEVGVNKKAVEEEREQEHTIYWKAVQQQIKRNRLYHCKNLPQNCLQLVYYCSYSVSQAERHERIKNTISRVMLEAAIPFANLQDIAILVHYLTCYMHENHVVAVLKKMAQRLLQEGSPVAPAELEGELPLQRLWRCIYQKSYIGNIITIIGYLLGNWDSFDENLAQLQRERRLITSKKQLESLLKEGTNLTNGKKSRSKTNMADKSSDHITKQCRNCQKVMSDYLKQAENQKNHYSLILRSLLREDAVFRDHIEALESRFHKEKEEFINKIIRLKDKIQVLESVQDGTLELTRRPRSASERKIKRIYQSDMEVVSEKSEGTSRTIENPSANKVCDNVFSESQRLQQPSRKVDMSALHKLLIQLPDFDPSLLAEDTPSDHILDALDSSIKAMNDKLSSYATQVGKLENESKRLLGILARKEERFVPLIHQKDELIEKYENALWKMENGLPVTDEALAPRIMAIFNLFKNEILQTISVATIDEDLRSSLMEPEPLPSPPKDSPSKKKKKKVIQKEEKECRLF